MKKILFAILVALTFVANAAARDDSKYLRGAVPEKDGLVTFTQTFSIPGKTQAEIYPVMQAYIHKLVAEGRQDLRTRVVAEANDTIVAKVEEIMTFKKMFLSWDHCHFRYVISVECTADSKVKMTITRITYQYMFDNEGNGGEHYTAEEWISDSAAINKAGTKLYPRSGKFRRKTVDRVEEIFAGAREAFETPAPAPAAAAPKATVVE